MAAGGAAGLTPHLVEAAERLEDPDAVGLWLLLLEVQVVRTEGAVRLQWGRRSPPRRAARCAGRRSRRRAGRRAIASEFKRAVLTVAHLV